MIGYSVAVHRSNWPTMQALQDCIDRRGWPVKLGDATDPQWTKPLVKAPSALGIPVAFTDEPIELEADFVTLEPDQTVAFNERLANIDATAPRFEEGDQIVGLIFRANLKEYQAGFYLLSALIICFGGYGLYGHYMHGTPIGVDALMAEAAEAAKRELRPPPPPTPDDLRRFGREFLEAVRKAGLLRNGSGREGSRTGNELPPTGCVRPARTAPRKGGRTAQEAVNCAPRHLNGARPWPMRPSSPKRKAASA
jgi:hypothetical protein